MMLPSNTYLYLKIMFYNLTGRGDKMEREKRAGVKKEKSKKSLLGSFST